MSSLPGQAILVFAFLMLTILFQNSMANDSTNLLDNTSLISDAGSLGYINSTTTADEGESILATIKGVAGFQVDTTHIFISVFFYILIMYELILVYLLLHPFKGG